MSMSAMNVRAAAATLWTHGKAGASCRAASRVAKPASLGAGAQDVRINILGRYF
jgi:hypothetical protein